MLFVFPDVPTPRDRHHHHSSHSSPPPHHRSSLATMNNYQPSSSHKQYNDPQLQRIENRMMMDNRAPPRAAVDGYGTRPTLYEDTLLRTQLREQERRAALLRTLSRPVDHNRPSDFSSPPRGVGSREQNLTHRLSPSILDNGPTNLSIDNSTEIRVLNDIPLPQSHDNNLQRASTSSRHRHTAKLKTQNNYVPAYERLYGSQPGDNLYDSEQGSQDSLPNAAAGSVASHKRTIGSDHLERLREKIEQQKSSLGASDPPSSRIRHLDTDPIALAGEHRLFASDTLQGRAPVRKVASAPVPAPTYKGFTEVETRYRMPDGSIVDQDLAKKTTRKRSSKSAKAHNDINIAKNRALQPSRVQPQHKGDAKTSRANASSSGKPVRKVQKISESKKPKRLERTGIISTTSWRDGQKAVLKVLGPAPKPQKQQTPPHSPPTRDTMTSESVELGASDGRSSAAPTEEDELSQHPMESEKDGSDKDLASVDNLPSDAKDVLEDLQLDHESDTDSDDEKFVPASNNDNANDHESTSRPSRKKKVTRGSSRTESEILPAKRVRHYNANDVQKYIAKQRVDRKKKQQDDKKQRMLAEQRKQEQLQELFRRQKESAKVSKKPAPDNIRQRLDETFSKEPGTMSLPDPSAAPRQRSVQINMNNKRVSDLFFNHYCARKGFYRWWP